MIVKKKVEERNLLNRGLYLSRRGKKESEKKNKYLYIARELKKTMEHEVDGDTSCVWCTWNDSQRIGKGTGELENKKTKGDYLDDKIIEIDLNTEKSPGDSRRLAVTLTPVKDHPQTLV